MKEDLEFQTHFTSKNINWYRFSGLCIPLDNHPHDEWCPVRSPLVLDDLWWPPLTSYDRSHIIWCLWASVGSFWQLACYSSTINKYYFTCFYLPIIFRVFLMSSKTKLKFGHVKSCDPKERRLYKCDFHWQYVAYPSSYFTEEQLCRTLYLCSWLFLASLNWGF
jgi:hypothetical protein